MTLLQASGLCWRPPGDGVAVLDHLDLRLVSGEVVSIEGDSGSGKSTLLRCLVALEPLASGTVRFDGQPVGPETVLHVRRAVALVSQQPAAIASTLGEDLALARHAGGWDEATQRTLLDRLGLDSVPWERSFDRLSVGERQRVCLVRTLTRGPQVLLLDEPTSALDTGNVALVEEVIAQWLAEDASRAALWITHDPAQAERVAHRRLTLAQGRLS